MLDNSATDKHLKYVIFIAFTQQKWLREQDTILRHTYIACLLNHSFQSSSSSSNYYSKTGFPAIFLREFIVTSIAVS